MIDGIEHIRDMFSIFHDGTIVSYEINESDLTIVVEIPYLAQRISSEFKTFTVVLKEIASLSFSTWPIKSEEQSEIILESSKIFEPDLDILSAEISGMFIKIFCGQDSNIYTYCGGELCLSCLSANVKDQAGKFYSIEELNQLCNEYWDEWANKKA